MAAESNKVKIALVILAFTVVSTSSESNPLMIGRLVEIKARVRNTRNGIQTFGSFFFNKDGKI
ncbi:MAG: hypothetical protein J7L35_06325 [Anaerolineales bacterium]|nr:hypothetical protein [Anaerolineales bacterium]